MFQCVRPLLLAVLSWLVLAPTSISAQQLATTPAAGLPDGEITIATRAVEPFVIRADGNKVVGFSIDLWQAIAKELNLKSRLVIYDTLPEMLEAVRTGRNAAGISAISITSARERQFEFSQPMYQSGLGILVPTESLGVSPLGLLFSGNMLQAFGIALLTMLIPAHIFWLIARGRDRDFVISRAYYPGIVEAIFWCAEAMGGAAQGRPHRFLARLVALVWIYTGVILITYFTAFVTTSLTTQTLRGDINGPGDLAGRRVGVVAGSTSATYMASHRARRLDYPDANAAAAALIEGKVDAVVYDAPVLLYIASKEARVRLAGSAFRPESYGIIFPIGSPLRRPVNQTLLTLGENGVYSQLQKKWFGEKEGDE